MINRIELSANDVLVYKGEVIDCNVLDAIVDVNNRLLWAFLRNQFGDVCAVPYSEEQVIWMTSDDVLQPQDVEI